MAFFTHANRTSHSHHHNRLPSPSETALLASAQAALKKLEQTATATDDELEQGRAEVNKAQAALDAHQELNIVKRGSLKN